MDAKIWSDMLHPDISIIEKIARPVIVYFFLVVGLRLAGKRELAQLNLKKELITLFELESAAHKQGFGSLDEVDHAQIEPGGTFSFIGRKPPPEAERHSELLARLDQITRTQTKKSMLLPLNAGLQTFTRRFTASPAFCAALFYSASFPVLPLPTRGPRLSRAAA